jgi:hypothetical protein
MKVSDIDLDAAGRRFHRGEGPRSARQYRSTIRAIALAQRSPRKMAVLAVELLYSWGGIRKPVSLKPRLITRLDRWLRQYQREYRTLSKTHLEDLARSDFLLITDLAGGLAYPTEYIRHGGRNYELMTATAWGKLMHFVMPQTIVLWDDAWVRRAYGLGDDPYSFTCYQAFCQRLLSELERDPPGRVESWVQRHSAMLRGLESTAEGESSDEFVESRPKLVDELVYDRGIVRAAQSAIGWALPSGFRFAPAGPA